MNKIIGKSYRENFWITTFMNKIIRKKSGK
jgi:hypothetical protein